MDLWVRAAEATLWLMKHLYDDENTIVFTCVVGHFAQFRLKIHPIHCKSNSTHSSFHSIFQLSSELIKMQLHSFTKKRTKKWKKSCLKKMAAKKTIFCTQKKNGWKKMCCPKVHLAKYSRQSAKNKNAFSLAVQWNSICRNNIRNVNIKPKTTIYQIINNNKSKRSWIVESDLMVMTLNETPNETATRHTYAAYSHKHNNNNDT